MARGKTQCEILLDAFLQAPNNTLSMGYIERELYLSQGNARLLGLKRKGYEFEDMGRDQYGFKRHRLVVNPLLNKLVNASALKIAEIRAEVEAKKQQPNNYKQEVLI